MKIRVTTVFALLFLFTSLALAQNPSPTCTPTPTPSPTATCHPQVNPCSSPTPTPFGTPDPNDHPPVEIPEQFQPQDGTTTRLEWRIFPPTDGSSSPWPIVIVLHEGHFAGGSFYGGTVVIVAEDLARQGYYVLIPSFRAAPCGLIKGQPPHDNSEAGTASGRPPQQTNDVEAVVRAARVDTHGTGKVGVVGGSSGGSHAAWVALDTVTSIGWPGWSKEQRRDAVVCLSGNYDFGDRIDPGYEDLDDYIFKVENYTNTCKVTEQRTFSPISKVTSDIKPMYLINSVHDTMPVHQIVALECALQSAGADHNLWKAWTIPDSSEHGYGYWNSPICDTPAMQCSPSIKVRHRVVDFLNQYLKTP